MSELLVNGVTALNDPELILFDKDGTLIDIHHYWASMIRIRSELIVDRLFSCSSKRQVVKYDLIDAMGVDQARSRMKPEGPVGVKPRPFIVEVATQTVRMHGANIDILGMEELFKEVDAETAKDLSPLLRLLPGAIDLLDQCRRCAIPVAIVSTDITERACKAMEALNIDHYFVDIVGGDCVKNTKPAPDLAEWVLDKRQPARDKVVVIGDHPVDIRMGIAAGISANVGVLTGLSDVHAFEGLDCLIAADLTAVEVRC